MKKSINVAISGLLLGQVIAGQDVAFNQLVDGKAKEGETIAVLVRGSDWNKLGEWVKENVWDQGALRSSLTGVHFADVDHKEHAKRDFDRAFLQQRQKFSKPLKLDGLVSSHSATSFKALADGSYQVSGSPAKHEVYTVTADIKKPSAVLILECLGSSAHPKGRAGRSSNGNFAINEIKAEVDGKPVKFVASWASDAEKQWKSYLCFDGKLDHDSCWNGHGHRNGTDKTLALVASEPIVGKVSLSIHFNAWDYHSLGRFRMRSCDQKAVTQAVKSWHAGEQTQLAHSSLYETWPELRGSESLGTRIFCGQRW